VILLAVVGPAAARTITLTADDCDRMAGLSPKSPRSSWALVQYSPGTFDTAHQLQLYQGHALLMRFPLDQIPKGQRITKAELTVKVDHVDGAPLLPVRRVLAEWGHGVCHLYRMTYPEKIAWSQPGGQGAAADRAHKDTAVIHAKAIGEYTIDVTEDVELWYTGAAANRGWIFAIESGYSLFMPSPYSPARDGGKQWKLRITYEPQ
jgi:hypothetical protein